MKKKHILVICQYFYPEEFRINDICKEWIKRGYEVTVVTGIPNYPQGKFYKGYSWFKKTREEYEGIRIIRIPIVPRGKNSIMMILNYISYVISGFWWKTFTKVKADMVFIFQLSPMTQALVGVWYAKKKKIPCYIYVQDLWPESVTLATGITNKIVISPINKMVDYIYKKSDKIFATSESNVDAICNRPAKVPSDKVIYWPQYAEAYYKPQDKLEAFEVAEKYNIPRECFKIIFTGNIGTTQGLDILPQVAKKIDDEKIKFVIVGEGRYLDELKNKISRNDVENHFIMVPRQPSTVIPMLLAACDVAFISFRDEKTIPAKLQSYMACGMPILAVAKGEIASIINKAGCGYSCERDDIDGIADIIKKMSKEDNLCLRKNSLIYYKNNFEKALLLDKMDSYIDEVL